MGANQPVVEYIDRDDGYIAEMVRRATVFMECVRTRTVPVQIDEPVPAPIPGKVLFDSKATMRGQRKHPPGLRMCPRRNWPSGPRSR